MEPFEFVSMIMSQGHEHKEKPLFATGQIKESPEISAKTETNPVLVEFLKECLYRHRIGDGGDLTQDEKVAHFEDIMNGNQVQSNFVITEEVAIFIITNKSRTHTMVLLNNELPDIPNEYLT